MKNKLDTIVDGIIALSNKHNVEVTVEKAFTNSNPSLIVQNSETGTYGLIGVGINEYPDEDIVFFTFNNDLYTYGAAEGFSRDDMMNKPGFKDKVMAKVTLGQFTNFVLNI